MECPFRSAHTIISLCLALLIGSISHAASGDVDSLNANIVGIEVHATAAQADGKIIIAGEFTSVLGVVRNNIARLNADGTLDAGFNPDVNDKVNSLAVQWDGQILLGGEFTSVGGTTRNRIARVAADGTLDTDFNPDANSVVNCVALQADGQILLGGNFTSVGGIMRNRIARVATNGTVDAGFDPNANSYVYTIAAQEDGQILLGGNFTSVSGITRNRIARVAANGMVDAGFNPNSDFFVRSVAVQADGQILLAGGFTSVGGMARSRIARVAANGTVDAGFNPNADSTILSLALQADGQILLGGDFTRVGGTTRNRVARLAVSGALDLSFNPNVNDYVYGMTAQADGKILLGGIFTSVGGTARNRFTRLINDPATQTLSALDSTQVLWTRGGGAPDVTQVTFELSTDGGSNYTLLGGTATRGGSTAHWRLASLSLPASGLLRARGRSAGGNDGSSSLVEQVVSFSGLAAPAATVTLVTPPIGSTGGSTNVTITGTNFTGTTAVTFGGTAASSFIVDSATQITATVPAHAAGDVDVSVTKPTGSGLGKFLYTYVTPPTVTPSTASLQTAATTLTISGTGFSTIPGDHTSVVFVPAGSGMVTSVSATSVTISGLSGLSLGALRAIVTSNGLSSGAAVQVATVVVTPPGTLDSLDAAVVGTHVYTTAVQPDGKTIIAGAFTSVLGVARNNIARLNADGTLDAGFNPDVEGGTVSSVVVQADGQILLGGSFTSVGGTTRNRISRVAANGTLDATFNPNANNSVNSMALQADGQILIGGSFTDLGGIVRNRIARVAADGTLDGGFDPNLNGRVWSVALQAGGQILLGGEFTSVGGTTRNRIARVESDGSLDMDFDPNASAVIFCTALQADGQILLGGNFTTLGGTARNRIARVSADGTLDIFFNPTASNAVRSLVVQSSGQILVGGDFISVGGSARSYIARLAAVGTLDSGFNPSANGIVWSVAAQADGQILLGGSFTTVGGMTRNRFARLINDSATQALSAVDSTQVLWSRGGSAPDVTQVTFELSTDGGSVYTLLGGTAMRGGISAHWKLTGLSLPSSGHVRVRGRTSSGTGNGSSGMVEQLASFSGLAAPASSVTLVTPRFGSTAGGTSVTITGMNFTGATSVSFGGTVASSFTVDSDTQITATTPAHVAGAAHVTVTKSEGSGVGTYLFTYASPPTLTASTTDLRTSVTTLTINGTGFNATPGNNIVFFTPTGTGTVTAVTSTSLTVTGIFGLTSGALHAVVTANGLSSSSVQVATVIVEPPGTLELLDVNIQGDVTTTAVQPDGKIIIAGFFTSVLGVTRNNIARLNADGTLDLGFNPNVSGNVSSVAVQADGQILLGGGFTSVGGITRNCIARVAVDGTLDANFNPNANNSVTSVVVQADGQILLGGAFTSVGGITRNRIARVAADGTLDTGFNPNANNNINCVVVQPDGQILLAGNFTSVGGIARNYIARVAADGTLDTNFNPNANNSISCVAVQADGQILLSGNFSSVGGVARYRIARLTANGALDTGFNPTGSNPVFSIFNILGVVVQADGKILLGGSFTSIGSTARDNIARLSADGTLDMGFAPDVETSVSSVAIQADGRILLGGVGVSPPHNFVRLLNDPAVQMLNAVDTTQVLWTRGGSAPEITQTTFEVSTNGGISFTPLGGTAARVGDTAHWHLTGLNLPSSGLLRARGRTASGSRNCSSGLVEATLSFSGLYTPAATVSDITPGTGDIAGGSSVTITGANFTGATSVTFGGVSADSFTVVSATQITAIAPAHVAGRVDVVVTTPEGYGTGTQLFNYAPLPTVTASTANLLTNVTTLTITGTGFSTLPANNTVTFSPTGACTVTSATATSLIVTGLSGLTLGALHAVVTTNGLSSGAAVQVATVLHPPPGTLDTLNVNFVGSNNVNTTAVQPNGKMIIAGRFDSVLGQSRSNIARLNADGTLDAGFNPNVNGDVYCVAVQADGKILFGGSFISVGGTARNYMARVGEDGTLDMGFNPNPNSGVFSLAVQMDGQILLGGDYTSVSGTECNYIARVAADGTLDAGFNPNANNGVSSVAVQADGQILLGGYFTSVGGATRNRIARVAPDGTLDMGFNPNANSNVYSVVVQADGQILLGGFFTSVGGIGRNRIARVAADGTLDAGFDPNANYIVSDVAVQADGRILLGGSFNTMGGTALRSIARVEADGTLDTSFNPNVDGGVDTAELQADGRILIGGTFTTVGGTIRRNFARLLNDPATQTLSAVDATQVLWTRGGSAPDVTQATFELSTDGGSSFISLGAASRVGSSANWQLTSLHLPASGQLRARGRTTGKSGSSLIEQVTTFSGLVPIPDIIVEQTDTLADGTGSVPFTTTSLGSSTPLTFTITNPSYANLTGLAVTVDGPDASDFNISALSATSIPAVPATATATFTVTFSPKSGGTKTAALHIASNVLGAKNPFDLTLTGIGRVTSQASQTIAFMPPTKLYLAEGPLTLSASTSSGLPITFTVVSGPATVQGNVLTLTGPGAVKVRASQLGDSDFLAATSVDRTITVAANPTVLTLTDLNQTYTGTPRPITVLGAAGPVDVTYKVGSSFVSNAPIDVGTYPVKAGTKTGTLVITKAPLFVQPYDQRKFAGQANPVLGFGYSGFFGSDNAANSVSKAPVIATTATATSAGGLYPITASGGASANYLFVYQKGTMMVETFAASYEAMLVDAGTTRPSAKLELTMAASSKTFTAKLITSTETAAVGLNGTLTTNPLTETATGTATVKKGTNTYLVTVTLPLAGDFTAEAKLNGAVIGNATNGKKLLTLAKGQTLSYIGTHSALLAPATGVGAPAGAGWAVATIDAKGLLKLTGKLADGSNLTASLAADVGSNPGYRLFIQPYTPARTGTFLAGSFALKPQTDEGLTGRRYVAFEDEADLTWVKAPRLQDTSYRAGIGPVDTRFTLDPWLPPTPAKGLVPAITLAQRLGLTANQFTAQHSTISSTSFGDIPLTLALSATNTVSVIAPATTPANSTKWKVTLSSATGAFVGSFELNDAGKKRLVPFTGMMRQPPSTDTSGLIGNGNFQLPSLSPAPNNEILSGEVGFER